MRKLNIKNMPQLPFNTAEALQQLRVNLGFCGDDIKTVMMTSSVPNEGKSFLTMYLWEMMAQVGGTVLFIDCDLRKSTVRRKYGLSTDDGKPPLGLASYLSGKAKFDEVIYETSISGGYVIPVVTKVTNPGILLEKERFSDLLEHCAKAFDYVLLDTPPLGSVADGLTIAKRCDGCVLVVRSGSTSRKLVENSVSLINRTGTPLLGIVLNRTNMSDKTSSYYRRYYSSYEYKKDYGKKSDSEDESDSENKKRRST